ncbi:MAG TPA: AbrB/MazE/SpoVT family DNA-binding domain-containing protein [Candidatus Norongarragalinales archaeon]|nr:AbrB/MazE/SpoVT family DNA-binding domain-containing protein [Candidatus Norongarragalinales archaeon]
MTKHLAHISDNGMVTIPKHIRDKLGIDSETPLLFEVEGDHVVVRKVKWVDSSVVDRLRKKYGIDKRTTSEIVKEIRQVRRELYDKEYG